MRVALILTTINIPTVLSLYRAHDPDVRFFVAVEKSKRPTEIEEYLAKHIPNSFFCCIGSPEWRCSDFIGWNTIARRNIALLEALKWGAEILISCDDDNIPIDGYAQYFKKLWYHPPGHGARWYRRREDINGAPFFNGVMARPHYGRWFDPASLCFPKVVQRGFPQELDRDEVRFKPVTGAKIGIAQGMILGDPDTSAVDRISQHPEVHQVSELLRAGIVTDPGETWAPLNSQNIAFVRELAPCFLMVPAYKRGDDIYAGLVAQRIMREHGYHIHFGQPFVLQQRNPHNLLKDLADEQWASEHILDFAAWLDGFLGQTDVIGMLRVMATNLPKFIPAGTRELWLAWLQDCEGVL
jgi:hypothetical protein